MTTRAVSGSPLSPDVDAQLGRLLELRAELRRERASAPTPAVDHALRLAEVYLQIALGYCGHTSDLFPEEIPDDPVPPDAA